MEAVITGGSGGKVPAGVLPVFKMTLVRNRETRPQYVTMIRYEQRWVVSTTDVDEYNEPMEVLRVVPVRRTCEWVRSPDGEDERLVCVRSTELRWRDIKPQPAHREFIEVWTAHAARAKQQMAALKKGARPVQVEVVP
jgi:hypothetical protein